MSNFSALPWSFQSLHYVDLSNNAGQLALPEGFASLMPTLEYARVSNGTTYNSVEFQLAADGGAGGTLLLHVVKA